MVKDTPEYLRRRLKEIPEKPGVYLFKDRDGKPVYIGKALSLKKRVADHFRHFGEETSKEGIMLAAVRRVDTIETATEAEALLLEASLVKEMLPKYNKMLRDDKSYPYLKITSETWPRLMVVRARKADGGKYFGPYTEVGLLRKAVKMLRIQYPLRTCKTMPKKVCLMYHLKQCGGPCEGHQTAEDYRATVKELEKFLEGRKDSLVRNLSKRMREHSQSRDFEKAQALRDAIQALASVPMVGLAPKDLSRLLDDFQRTFDLERLPVRIECFDISNIQGREPVASMVVFLDGAPARAEYRRFKIRTVQGIDDYRMMREVVRRRYEKVLRGEAPMPDLILIDGGKGHLSAAKSELDAIGFSGCPLMSIAKQHEILFTPGRATPYILPGTSEVLKLIRHIRDEAHRFAITFHRRRHRQEALVSGLDRIPGLGPKTRQRLLTAIGSVAKIRRSTEEELMSRAGLSAALAKAVKKELGS